MRSRTVRRLRALLRCCDLIAPFRSTKTFRPRNPTTLQAQSIELRHWESQRPNLEQDAVLEKRQREQRRYSEAVWKEFWS